MVGELILTKQPQCLTISLSTGGGLHIQEVNSYKLRNATSSKRAHIHRIHVFTLGHKFKGRANVYPMSYTGY